MLFKLLIGFMTDTTHFFHQKTIVLRELYPGIGKQFIADAST